MQPLKQQLFLSLDEDPSDVMILVTALFEKSVSLDCDRKPGSLDGFRRIMTSPRNLTLDKMSSVCGLGTNS